MKKFTTLALAGAMSMAMVGSAFAGAADAQLGSDNVVVIFGTDEETGEATGFLNLNGLDITDVYGIRYYVTYDQAELDNADTWIGGGIGFNSTSGGWDSVEWGKASGEKPISIETELNGTSGTITRLDADPAFTADDTWAQGWIQTWGGTVTVTGVDLLAADGSVLGGSGEAGDTAPVAYLAAAAALAGLALVVTRKKMA